MLRFGLSECWLQVAAGIVFIGSLVAYASLIALITVKSVYKVLFVSVC